jgi:hypothetical protein
MGNVAGLTVERTPDQFADDLSRFVAMDWNTVWRGEQDTHPGDWTRRNGWQLRGSDPDLNLSISFTGEDSIALYREHNVSDRFGVAGQILWRRAAARAADNPAVISDVVTAWPPYLAVATTVLGPADSTAGDGHFELPSQATVERNPLRGALWAKPDAGAVFTLWVSLALGTREGTWPGSASVSLLVTPYRNAR